MRPPLNLPRIRRIVASAGLCLWACLAAAQVAATSSQQLVFAGLRTSTAQGQINGVQADASGNLYLLLDQGDGVRLLKTDNAGNAVLAQALLGAAGDTGTALALDPAGNVYVTGTTTSSTLAATAGSAIPNRTDASTNSFVAKYDASLNQLFVSFTGGSRIAASALSATADAVFVTGILYGANLPVTNDGIQQAPAPGSTQNGFVERFSASGTTLVYATYLTGAAGDTTPQGIVADASDNAYLVGATSASGFPTVAALVPTSLSNPSGFLTKLTAAGDAITFSTFVPGAGLSSVALDSTGQTLLVSGAVALGQFPVDTVATPLVPTTYQVLLRLPLDGSAVLSSTLLAPGMQSFVAAGPGGGAWVDGVLTAPLLPITPLAGLGSGFAVHVSAAHQVDHTARFGGLPNGNPTFAAVPTLLTSIAVDAAGEPIVAGAVQPTGSASLLATQTYDLPLRNTPTPALPSGVRAAELTAATCNGSLCAGSAGYLAKLNTIAGAPSLTFSADDLPFVVLRNLGSVQAEGLQLSATGATFVSTCGAMLVPGGQCDVLLSGVGAGTLTSSAANGASQTISFGALPSLSTATTIVFAPKELDFGIETSTSVAATRTITVTNLGTQTQTFTSALDASANPKGGAASPFAEASSDCTPAGSVRLKSLAPGGTCHVTVGLTASSAPTSDGFLNRNWSIGGRDVLLTGYSQAATLSVSAAEVDFGTQFKNGLRLPRYLYLSNASSAAQSHATLTLPAGSPFTVTDGCPATLLAGSVCRIRIDYLSVTAASTDSVVLSLDQGLSVLVTGETLPPRGASGSSVNPNLTVTPTSLAFANAVPVTAGSGTTQTVTISNTGSAAFALALGLAGDFTDVNSCGATLAGGQSCSVVVSFTPSGPGTRSGLLAVTAGAGTSPFYVALSGTGTAILPPNNGTLDLGATPVGQPVTQFYKIALPFNALSVAATGPFSVLLVEDAGFGHGSPPASAFGSTAAGPCHNCFVAVQFTPSTAGLQTGMLTLTSAATGAPYVLGLTGTGLPVSGLLVSDAAHDFGAVPVHSSSGAMVLTVTNMVLGGTSVALSTPSVTGDFAVSIGPTGGAACGGPLAFGASCYVPVLFAPAAVGTRSGTLTVSYPGGAAMVRLTGLGAPDPGVAINPLSLTFTSVPGPSATTQTVTVTNSDVVSVVVGVPFTSTLNFRTSSTCGILAPGASCTLGVNYVPGSAIAVDTLAIPVTNSVTTTYTVALSGNYTAANAGLQILPGQVQFGPLAVGVESEPRLFTINNLSGRAVTLAVQIPHQFVLVGPPCTGLGPNTSCTFGVAFLPLANGDAPGTLLVQATPSDGSSRSTAIAYAEGFGIGTGALSVAGGLIVSGVYNFGQVASGQTQPQVFTLSNRNPAGTAAITVRRVTSLPPFLSTTTCGGALAVGQSCTVTVSYAPSNQVANGTVSPPTTADAGALTIESNAASSPDVVNLAGQGGAAFVSSPSNAAPLATFTLSQSSLVFPATTVGNNSPVQTVTLANTGTMTIHVTSAFATADFAVQNNCGSVVPGASCTLSIAATPQAGGVRVGALEIASDAATSLEFISLLGVGIASPLTLLPGSLDFGSVRVLSSATLPVQVTNTGASPVTFGAIAATGDYTASGTCPAPGGTLATGATCTLQVTFAPVTVGVRAGILSVATSASTNPLTVPLTGVGTQTHLSITPASLAFGSVPLNALSVLSLTLSNGGSTAITGISLATTGEYSVSAPCGVATLAPQSSCAVQVTFTPTALGSRPGTFVVTSSDAGSPAVVPLSGTAVQGGSFTLTVDGGASSIVSVVSGSPATYHLTVTPTGGFAGTVALTCTPVVAAQYASCSLLPASLTLSGGAQTSLATINTLTSAGGNARVEWHASRTGFLCLLVPGALAVWRGRRRRVLLAVLGTVISLGSIACGSGSAAVSPIQYTPAGAYQYQVTASSTNGVPVTQTVTLNLTVTAR